MINSPFLPDPPTSIVTNFYTILVKEPLPKKQDCFYLIAARRTIDILLRNTKQHTHKNKQETWKKKSPQKAASQAVAPPSNLVLGEEKRASIREAADN